MREKIYEIPVNEAFEDSAACPFCRLKAQLTANEISRISGAAMMEPDVRAETNAEGFCAEHFAMLASEQKVLPLALLLESHLDEVVRTCAEGDIKEMLRAAEKQNASCYVCRRVQDYFEQMLAAFLALYRSGEEFRGRLAACEGFCLPHYEALLRLALQLPRRERAAYLAQITAIEHRYLAGKREDISAFCKQFDYRAASLPPVKPDAPERAILALVGGVKQKKEGSL